MDLNSNRSNRQVNRSNRPVYRYEPVELSFLNSNLNFEFGPVWYRPKPKPGWTSQTGQTGPVPTGLVDPATVAALALAYSGSNSAELKSVGQNSARKFRERTDESRLCSS